ncbi:ulp1 protease family, C-terminal catalytic domain-containing protein [Tanacetum coccineum]|uniref:Ulp1 protease family, C-terminal catalytic domain-containing protein n=1 Tax=Tanacetum coccineum TaxID=301880 RepID=A0ABQ5H9Q9_9ASTR
MDSSTCSNVLSHGELFDPLQQREDDLNIADDVTQDHGGRTRGVSSIVGYKEGLTGYVRKKRTYKQSLDFKELSEKVQEKLMSGPLWNCLKEKLLEEIRKEPIVGTSSVRPTTSNIRIDCIKETTTKALKGYDFFVAPYLHNGHHALLLICPNHGRGVILDSVKWEPRKTKEDYYLVKQVERVVGHLSWEFLIVNVQEDNGTCLFLLKFIYEALLKVKVYKRVKFDQATDGSEKTTRNGETIRDLVFVIWS